MKPLLLLRLRKNGLAPAADCGEEPAHEPGESPPLLLRVVRLLQLLRAPLPVRLAVAIWRKPLAGFLQPQETDRT
jgi:hypothetical protein